MVSEFYHHVATTGRRFCHRGHRVHRGTELAKQKFLGWGCAGGGEGADTGVRPYALCCENTALTGGEWADTGVRPYRTRNCERLIEGTGGFRMTVLARFFPWMMKGEGDF